MRISELKEILNNNRIPQDCYSINEGLDEYYCIDEKECFRKNGKSTTAKEIIK